MFENPVHFTLPHVYDLWSLPQFDVLAPIPEVTCLSGVVVRGTDQGQLLNTHLVDRTIQLRGAFSLSQALYISR